MMSKEYVFVNHLRTKHNTTATTLDDIPGVEMTHIAPEGVDIESISEDAASRMDVLYTYGDQEKS